MAGIVIHAGTGYIAVIRLTYTGITAYGLIRSARNTAAATANLCRNTFRATYPFIVCTSLRNAS